MRECERDGFDDLTSRFSELADEAQGFGVYACVVLQTEDPISTKSQLSAMLRGGRMRAIGMPQQT